MFVRMNDKHGPVSIHFLNVAWLILGLSLPFNPFPYDKILDQTKLKAFADDKLNVTKMIISVFERVENIVGKGEIACTSNFFFSHNVFKRLLSQTRQKVSLCRNGLKDIKYKEKFKSRHPIHLLPSLFM